MAGTIGALHASGCFGECFFFGIDPVVEASGPVLIEVRLWNSFKFDLMLMAILFPRVSVDNLRPVELGGSRKYLVVDLLRIPGDCEPIDGASNNLREHEKLNEISNTIKIINGLKVRATAT